MTSLIVKMSIGLTLWLSNNDVLQLAWSLPHLCMTGELCMPKAFIQRSTVESRRETRKNAEPNFAREFAVKLATNLLIFQRCKSRAQIPTAEYRSNLHSQAFSYPDKKVDSTYLLSTHMWDRAISILRACLDVQNLPQLTAVSYLWFCAVSRGTWCTKVHIACLPWGKSISAINIFGTTPS